MTQSEFIKLYCKNSGVTEKELNKRKLFAMPCKCDSKDCKGWAMVYSDQLLIHLKLYYSDYKGRR